jgi:hypothetical protein
LRYLNHSTIFIARTRLVAGVDTIDITNAGTGWFSLNHNVYADSPTIVADMRQIMKATSALNFDESLVARGVTDHI